MTEKDQRPLPERILDWMSRQGYPFELRVGRTFRATGWDVEFAQLYTDLDSGKVREIDVVATSHIGDPKLGTIGFHWTIECKSTLDHPWVVLTAERRPGGIDPTAAYFAPGLVGTGVLLEAIGLGDRAPTLSVPERIGHGVVRAFSDGKSADPTGAYSALLGATSAAAALTKQNAEFWLAHGSESSAVINVFVPAVVVDGPLFEMTLASDGSETLEEVNRTVAWVRTPGSGTSASLVNIIRASAMDSFARQSQRDTALLLELTLPRARDIWQAMRTKAPGRAF